MFFFMKETTYYLEMEPTSVTKENLQRTLLVGERNDDPLKYQHNKIKKLIPNIFNTSI